MEHTPTRELYNQIQNRIILELQDNEIPCPDCKGMRFVYTEDDDKGCIKTCRRCHTGKLYVCKHCGVSNSTNYCYCNKAKEERYMRISTEQAKKDAKAFQSAEKIHYKDYDGKFLLEGSDYVKDIDDVEEWIYDMLTEGTEPPEYLWAVEKEQCFSIDLLDIIFNGCDGGYEDMYDCLDTKSPLLEQAQKLITRWEKEQGDSLCVFYTTYKKAIIIKDLVEEIRKEMV